MLYDKKKNYATLLLLINITLFAFPVQANLSHQYDKCVGDSGNNVTIGTCLTIEEEYQNKRFNKYYHQLLKLLTKPQKQAFILAQKSWTDFNNSKWAFWYTVSDFFTKMDHNPAMGIDTKKKELIYFSERIDKLKQYINVIKKNKLLFITDDLDDGFSDVFNKCINDGTSFVSVACANSEQIYQNEQLSNTYEKLLKILNKDQREDIVNYQKYWFLFYQNEFSFRNALNYQNNPILLSNLRIEKLNFIIEQTNDLKDIINYEKENNEFNSQ